MNIFSLFGKEEKKSSFLIHPPPEEDKTSGLSMPLETKATKANKLFVDNVNNVSEEKFLTAYQKADIVYSCVNYAADICSQVKLKIYQRNSKNELKPYKDKKIQKWFEAPNPFQSMSEIISLYVQSHLLTGNAYLTFEKVGLNFEGWVLDPTKTEIVPHPKKYIQGFLYNKEVAYKDTEIIFFRNPTVANPYYGQGVLASLIDPLEIEAYAVDDLIEFYKNSLIAQGIFTSEYPLTQQQIESLRKQFEQLYGMKGEARHGHIIAPNNLKYQPMRVNPKDGLLLEALNISEDRIYKAFRIPPVLLGGGTKNSVNGTEIEGFKRLYVNNFIRPLITRMTRQWEVFFRRILKDDSIVIVADYDDIPEVNTALTERIDAVRSALSIGVLSLNEARDALGYDKLQGAYVDSHLAASFLYGTSPLDLVSGETLNFAPTNQQPKPQGSTNPEGGKQDGEQR